MTSKTKSVESMLKREETPRLLNNKRRPKILLVSSILMISYVLLILIGTSIIQFSYGVTGSNLVTSLAVSITVGVLLILSFASIAIEYIYFLVYFDSLEQQRIFENNEPLLAKSEAFEEYTLYAKSKSVFNTFFILSIIFSSLTVIGFILLVFGRIFLYRESSFSFPILLSLEASGFIVSLGILIVIIIFEVYFRKKKFIRIKAKEEESTI